MPGRAADHPNVVGYAENLKGGNASTAVSYPSHVKNWSDKAHHLEQIPADKRTPEEHAAYKKASKQSMYGNGQSAEYKAHLSAAKKSGAGAKKYDHPNVVGQAENLQGGDASKAHGMSFAGKKYSASGKTGKSFHDQTPVRHFRETGCSSGEDVWLDDDGRVHADSTDDVRRLVERYEAHTGSGHAIPAGPVRHDDSQAADRWYAGQTAKLTAAGYDWLGFTIHGATWRNPDHGALHIQHAISNPADPSDASIYSTVVHGEKGLSIEQTLGG